MKNKLTFETQAKKQATIAAFKSSHPDKVKTLRILDIDWPMATGVYQHFVSYVSRGIRIDGIPLVEKCLADALDSYENNLGCPDNTRINGFIDSMFVPAVEALSDISVQAGDQLWTAENGVPLSSWLDDYAAVGQATLGKRDRAGDKRLIRNMLENYVLEGGHGE